MVPKRLVSWRNRITSQGISLVCICDGPLYKDKKVVVIGGGNSAVEEALFLSNIAQCVILGSKPNAEKKHKTLLMLKMLILYLELWANLLGDIRLKRCRTPS